MGVLPEGEGFFVSGLFNISSRFFFSSATFLYSSNFESLDITPAFTTPVETGLFGFESKFHPSKAVLLVLDDDVSVIILFSSGLLFTVDTTSAV